MTFTHIEILMIFSPADSPLFQLIKKRLIKPDWIIGWMFTIEIILSTKKKKQKLFKKNEFTIYDENSEKHLFSLRCSLLFSSNYRMTKIQYFIGKKTKIYIIKRACTKRSNHVWLLYCLSDKDILFAWWRWWLETVGREEDELFL